LSRQLGASDIILAEERKPVLDKASLNRRRTFLYQQVALHNTQTDFQASIFPDVFADAPTEVIRGSADSFIQRLQYEAQERFAWKDELVCYSSGQGDGKTYRHIWLDADTVRISPEEFVQRHLPKTRTVIYSTFRSTREKPRFRIFVPTLTLMGGETYTVLAHAIVGDVPGFDPSRLSYASRFHRPSLAKAPGGSFFMDSLGQPLDPRDWIEQVNDEILWAHVPDPEPNNMS
jgi:hypothetical protein